MAGTGSRPPLREQQRGEAPPCRERQRIGRPHRLEELDELLAPRLLVPIAVALDELQKLVDRLLALARGEKRRREFRSRLVVPRILREASPQLVGRARRLGAGLGELERGAR